MPTPEWVREASRKKRERICVICGEGFLVRSVDRVGRTCSTPCLKKVMSANASARKPSKETIEKRKVSMKLARADPERKAMWDAATKKGRQTWLADPANFEAQSKRSSERMKRRHADPEWQKVRDERSSRVMKANWQKYRDVFTEQAVERYAKGIGVAAEWSIKKKNEAAKWIMKMASRAMHTETEYDAVYKDVQERLRSDMPYDGPQGGSDYMDYLSRLGRAVTNSVECRTIADMFMAEAIPRFAKEWKERQQSQAAEG